MSNAQIVYRSPELAYSDMRFMFEIKNQVQKFLDALNIELVKQGMHAVLVDTVGFIEVRKDE